MGFIPCVFCVLLVYEDKENLMNKTTREVLIMKANGLQSKQISDKLGLHLRTVEYHLNSARKELNAKTVCHAIAKAMRDGLIVSGEIGMVLLLSWSCLFGQVDIRRGPRPPTVSRQVRRESIV